MKRHEGIAWADVQAKIEASPAKLWSLSEMERTDGEPDVVGIDEETGEFIFFDCSPESPAAAACYDRAAWESRKEHKPASSALELVTPQWELRS